MRTIWKFEVPIQDVVVIKMPKEAKVLFASVQHGKPCFWAEVDTFAPLEKREFRIYGTGHQIPDYNGRYLGTFMMHGDQLVFHAYE